jgi:hypothetical protein
VLQKLPRGMFRQTSVILPLPKRWLRRTGDMENRNGLLVQTFLTEANGRAERDAAMLMAEALPGGSGSPWEETKTTTRRNSYENSAG